MLRRKAMTVQTRTATLLLVALAAVPGCGSAPGQHSATNPVAPVAAPVSPAQASEEAVAGGMCLLVVEYRGQRYLLDYWGPRAHAEPGKPLRGAMMPHDCSGAVEMDANGEVAPWTPPPPTPVAIARIRGVDPAVAVIGLGIWADHVFLAADERRLPGSLRR